VEVVFRHVVHVVHEGAGAGRKGSRTLLFNSLVACVLNGWSSRTRNVLNAMVPFELGGTEGSRQQPRSTAAVRYYTKKAHHARIRHCHSPGGRTRTHREEGTEHRQLARRASGILRSGKGKCFDHSQPYTGGVSLNAFPDEK